MNEVTRIIGAIQEGNGQAAEELLPVVYAELRKLASRRLAAESPGQTLQATALVHEAYLRLIGQPDRRWDGRRHFFAAAAEAMRRILIDNARRKAAARHGGGWRRIETADVDLPAVSASQDFLALNEALKRLAAREPQMAELVKLRYFAGLTMEEVAEVLEISVPTAKRYWAYARAWLYREIAG